MLLIFTNYFKRFFDWLFLCGKFCAGPQLLWKILPIPVCNPPLLSHACLFQETRDQIIMKKKEKTEL